MQAAALMGPGPAPRETRITDTGQHLGEWTGILAITTATFTELISPSMSLNGADVPGAGQSHAGMVLAAGLFVRGIFTNITLASGSVVAYVPPVAILAV